MTTRMLIDARHREETRVAVIKGNRIEEFDFESAEHKQLKGNIYLAKVTRVEPSLQAAFIEYGGNRHGFLAFSEIHPDYYQIPREDREALMREEAEIAAEAAAMRAEDDVDSLEGDVEDMTRDGDDDDRRDEYTDNQSGDDDDHPSDEDHHDEGRSDDGHNDEAEPVGSEGVEGEPAEPGEEGEAPRAQGRDNRKRRGRGRSGPREEQVERPQSLRRRYKIQDVIRRRQVMLVQVVKEERGNKGAALTTYLSLAGRYCVLMPNTMHGGGISRKISNGADRRKLKAMIDELDLPPTMGCIVRTAGMQRTKVEIKRDFDYLARVWDEIRQKTLQASAPALVHSDSDLIKRAIRDIYHREIEEVYVEGEEGYRAAKEFMRLLMPSHARKVKQYADPVSLYQRYGVEDQLAGMYNPVVQLKSGGYLVINPTEALVSIDINSGRSTREHNIEQTAYSTNIEAAHEIARQLRLRDMAGLVVIDFIDMDHSSNVRKVERAMKDALKNDRARIQIGRISGFGLMEMSRQRLRTGVLEASTRACPHCEGTGLVRTASSAGLSALRMIEEEAARGRGTRISLRASQEASFYLLNEKRRELHDIEMLYGVVIEILPDGQTEGARMEISFSGPPPLNVPQFAPIIDADDDDDDIIDDEDEVGGEDEAAESEERQPRQREPRRAEGDGETEAEGEERKRRKRRRRGRRNRRGDEADGTAETVDGESTDAAPVAEGADVATDDTPVVADDVAKPKTRRRPSKARIAAEAAAEADAAPVETIVSDDAPVSDGAGEAEAAPAKSRRRTRKPKANADVSVADTDAAPADEPVNPDPVAAVAEAVEDAAPAAKPKRSRRKVVAAEVTDDAEAVAVEPVVDAPAPAPRKTPRRAAASAASAEAETSAPVAETQAVETSVVEAVAEVTTAAVGDDDTTHDGTPRRGWWQRTFG